MHIQPHSITANINYFTRGIILHEESFVTSHTCAKGKVIGSVIVVVIVLSTKITKSQKLSRKNN